MGEPLGREPGMGKCRFRWIGGERPIDRRPGPAGGCGPGRQRQGGAVTVWSQGDGAGYSILSNRYSAGSGWGSPNVVDGGQGDALSPQVGTDVGGDAVAVWEQSVAGRSGIWASRYVQGWTSPVQ